MAHSSLNAQMRGCRHWIVSEGLRYANGRYVPDMRHAFKFGQSLQGPLSDGLAALQVRDAKKGSLAMPMGGMCQT